MAEFDWIPCALSISEGPGLSVPHHCREGVERSAGSGFEGVLPSRSQRGFVHGKPAVMGNFWGKSLGVIDLALVREGGRWRIDPASTHSEVRDVRKADGSFVAPDPDVAQQIAKVHAATIAYVSQPIGDSDFAMTSYFAELGNVTALQPVNTAQREYVERYVAKNLPQYAGIPVLSAAAPFKTGFSARALIGLLGSFVAGAPEEVRPDILVKCDRLLRIAVDQALATDTSQHVQIIKKEPTQ